MKLLNNISRIAFSLIGIAKCSTATPFLSNAAAASSGVDSVFGIARGGGIFGGGNKKKDAVADVKDKLKAESGETFPALSQEQIEEWLGHIPVFAVTDSNGAGVVLKPDNETSVMYFFFSPQMANATLAQLKSTNDQIDLKLSAFSLGKIWFKMLNNGDNQQEIKLKQPGADDSEAEVLAGGNVEYRLVPDTRDLLGARMLLTMTPEDGEEMKKAGDSMTPELAQKAVEKAMTESPEFKENYNEVPVFLIAQMRMQKPASDEGAEAQTILPMYFSLQSMVTTWQQFMASQNDPELKDMEPAINVMNLHKLVEMMKEPSEIDFRSCLLLPPIPTGPMGGPGAAAAGMGAPAGAEAQMAGMGGGGTLGDI
mmetsp:Transcript_35983/g.61380  ORF Transcript_35983/g.61380 Transcript_35983/m.61380 type:complete len:368 (+) Transcript_35983:95-1198(+)|eukprot:CAMPEP_0183769180 /NCGR_PEP_ID=MMETSP0739-20130205/20851_1 /TAXON_ID=385413 /ORGANISM="Thalassiosira miniscula, Strain CCMP1093" /LENGTH=367 /DNA_ID=CAMNT_0026008703 /DNA_START=93 /DNA_END=1196 /DNA_ORIENTATION=+